MIIKWLGIIDDTLEKKADLIGGKVPAEQLPSYVDDVIDIALRVVAGVLLGAPYNTSVNSQLGDAVQRNDKTFASTFPYLAAPFEGYANSHGMIVAISDNSQNINPKEYGLIQNYPNPFNPSTQIKFNLIKSDVVVLKIYDVLGKEIRTLVNEKMNAGEKITVWDGLDNSGKSVASGSYFVKLETSAGVDSKKMTLLK